MKVSEEFLVGLYGESRRMGRNVCVAGYLYYGKMMLFDMLFECLYDVNYDWLVNDK